MAVNSGHLVNKSIEEFAVYGVELSVMFYAYLLAHTVICCHYLMNLCRSFSTFVRGLLVLFYPVLNRSLRLLVR